MLYIDRDFLMRLTFILTGICGFFLPCMAASENSSLPVPLVMDYCRPGPIEKTFGAACIKSAVKGETEIISLYNDIIRVTVSIDKNQNVAVTGITAENGSRFLARPFHCFDIVDSGGAVVHSGSGFKCRQWHSWIPGRYAELELRLIQPHPVVWRLRLYEDRPYLEQRFEMPAYWRQAGHSVRQHIVTASGFKPVMPNPLNKLGFKDGKPNLKGRHRFEYTPVSEHLVYDCSAKAGLAGFVAGIGGQEQFKFQSFMMQDHVTSVFGSDEPIAGFILFPFSGPAEIGFKRLKRFINDEYACTKNFTNRLGWTQFYDWVWFNPDKPPKQTHQQDPFHRESLTANRLLEVLPLLPSMGFERFHLDSGWEEGFDDWLWHFDPARFPNGYEPVRRMIRDLGMTAQGLWWGVNFITDGHEIIEPIVEQTDTDFIFFDRLTDEKLLLSIRNLRRKYPDIAYMNHWSKTRSNYWPQLELHFCSEMTISYFYEEQYFQWGGSNIPTGDLITRSLAYQCFWVWPFKSAYIPVMPWAGHLHGSVAQLKSRLNSWMASNYCLGDGFNPAELSAELRDYWLDFVAFYKANRYYLQEYQQVLPVPDGINPDGVAHLMDGRGFIFLFNPGSQQAEVGFKELFWDPAITVDPLFPLKISDWTNFMKPEAIAAVDAAEPNGGLKLAADSFRIIGVNIHIDSTLSKMKKYRKNY